MLKNAMLTFALLAASAAFAADGPVTINGCTSPGVENCLFIDTPQGKYALFVKPPRPDPGRGISVDRRDQQRSQYLHGGAGHQSRDLELQRAAMPQMSGRSCVGGCVLLCVLLPTRRGRELA